MYAGVVGKILNTLHRQKSVIVISNDCRTGVFHIDFHTTPNS